MQQPSHKSSLPELVDRIANHIATLFRGEVALLRAEVGEAAQAATRGVIFLVVALLIAFCALGALTASGILAGIAWGLSPLIASLVTGAALIVIAGIFTAIGISALKRAGALPGQTADRLQRDVMTLKEATRGTA